MTDQSNSYKQAAAQMQGIAEMVAALECDYHRLEVLRDERKDLADTVAAAQAAMDAAVHAGGGDSDLATAFRDAVADLQAWDTENADELQELEDAAGDCESEEQARERIEEDPLDIDLTGSWAPGEKPEASGFTILLCTGGPAVRIVGELNQHGEPRRAWIEHQDWGTHWQEYHGEYMDYDALLTYCRVFYFGEG